ncbi:hypothetical protein LIER_10387 [Lithospermum erythrorhizon]|uniref:Uncharacterized protein n=1 Tax=Lithospermum erythrorhizon TaxID=34254 RepID=A0AAV3PJ06_LITER
MSDTSNSRPEGQGYNSDVRSSSSPQVSSSLAALAGSGSSVPFQATPLSSRAPSSSRRPPQLMEKAQAEGALQSHLRNLLGEHNTLQEKHVASVRRTEAVKAELEGMQAERDSALLERDASQKKRDALEKERESPCTGRDEML